MQGQIKIFILDSAFLVFFLMLISALAVKKSKYLALDLKALQSFQGAYK